jgi:hypothetical protein
MPDDSAEVPFPVPGDEPDKADKPAEPAAANTPRDAAAAAPKPRKSRAKSSAGAKSKSVKAAEAAEGTADLVSQVGILVTPFTPLGGAYLLASSAEAERVAAHLAEVDPRVMAALTKARKVTAWSGAVSLAVGFVGAVMLERNMAPAVIGQVPIGPANVELGRLHAELVAAGHYDSWHTVRDGRDEPTIEGYPGEAEPDGQPSPLDVG